MLIGTFIQGLGSTGFFGSRAFVPAFITAGALRFGPSLPFLANSSVIQNMQGTPTWFTNNWTLLILGVLAGLEIASTKIPEARQILQEIDKYAKSAMAVVTYMGIASMTDQQFIEQNILPQSAGLLDVFPAAIIGLGVYGLASLRGGVLGIFIDADEDDNAGVQGLFSWAEDIWSLSGPVLLILYPILMIGLIAMVVGLLALIRWRMAVREERSKVPCPSCHTLRYLCACACPSCGTPNPTPHALGVLGQSKPYPAPDRDHHPLRLVSKKRCPVCATRFNERQPHQRCSACGHALFRNADFIAHYLTCLDKRVPIVVLVSFLFSLVPIVGLIPGVIFYRMTLIAPLRQYVPLHRRLLLKWMIRLLFFVLIAFQWIPGLGGFVVPAMALVSYVSYRATFVRSLHPLDSPPEGGMEPSP